MKYELSQRVCEICGAGYIGGSKSHYCQSCRRKLQSGWAREHGLNRMGNEAYSRMCLEKNIRKCEEMEE